MEKKHVTFCLKRLHYASLCDMCKLIFSVAKVTSNEILLDINSILPKAQVSDCCAGLFSTAFSPIGSV